ncbi:MAG: preprotein translocase subunit SecY [Rubrobacteraceae bacterium]
MLGALANAWRVPDLRRKLIFTAVIIALYRLGAFVPLPGVDASVLAQGGVDTQNSVSQLFGVFTGGAFNNLAVFSLGIMPYITAAIVMNLMTVAIPRLQELAREGDTGQQKITQYTRYFTLVLAFVQSIAMSIYFTRSDQFGTAVAGATAVDIFLMIITLTAGVMLIMWMGEQISQRGLGNGISLIITASIISQAPIAIQALLGASVLTLVVLGILLVIIVAAIVFVNEGQRRIPITYARRQVGRKMSQGGSTYLPLKVNMAGVIPIIFASSLLIFPTVLTQFASGGNQDSFLFQLAAFFGPPGQGNAGGIPYIMLYAMLIVMFTYFYTAVQFNPIEHAENLKKSGGYVPGYRPGRPTAEYLNTVLTRITLFGAFFLATVAVLPYLITPALGLPSTIFIGGTSILIVVGVSLDTVRQLESQLMMRNYEGFLRSGR